MLANLEYWWHTPKRCRKCWRRMKRVRLSMSGYRCVKCGAVRQHPDFVTHSIEITRLIGNK